jgi:hypothetical protein
MSTRTLVIILIILILIFVVLPTISYLLLVKKIAKEYEGKEWAYDNNNIVTS